MERHLHGVDGDTQVRASNGGSLLDIPLSFINRSLSLQTRVTFEVIERLGRLSGLIGGTRGEILIQKAMKAIAHERNSRTRQCRKEGGGWTYGSSSSSLLSGLSFSTSVPLNFIGNFESRCFGFGPLSGSLPSLVRGVRSGLDRFVGTHEEVRVEVVESMKVLVMG